MLRRRAIADGATLNNGRSGLSSQPEGLRTPRRRLRRVRRRIGRFLWREETVLVVLSVGLAIVVGLLIGHSGA
jgi:hypothetical protein